MSNTELPYYEKVFAWLATLSGETRVALAVRSAIRAMPVMETVEGDDFEKLVLPCLRWILVAAVKSSGYPEAHSLLISDAKRERNLVTEAEDVATSAGKLVYSAAASAHDAMKAAEDVSTKIPEGGTTDEVAIIVANARNSIESGISALKSVPSQIVFHDYADVMKQQETDGAAGHRTPVWQTVALPEEILKKHHLLLERFSDSPAWDFWRDWYQQMCNGTFRDWDLAIEVIKIPNEVWEEGLCAVAAAIRDI